MDTLTIIIASGILLVCIIIAFFAANRNTWRILKSSPAVEAESEEDSPTAVDHYTEMRDELTLKDAGVEEEEVEEESSSSGSGFSFIGSLVSLIISVVVFSTVWTTIKPMIQTMNATDSGMSAGTFAMTQQLFNWVPIVAIIGFAFIIITMFTGGLSSSDSSTTTKKKRKRGVKHYTSMRDKLSEK